MSGAAFTCPPAQTELVRNDDHSEELQTQTALSAWKGNFVPAGVDQIKVFMLTEWLRAAADSSAIILKFSLEAGRQNDRNQASPS